MLLAQAHQRNVSALPPKLTATSFVVDFDGYVQCFRFLLIGGIFINVTLAAFGNFTFNAPTTSAPPAFGAATAGAPQQTQGYGAPSAFGQNTFGATGA